MWSSLILNNERTESQTPWSSVAGTLISLSDGTPGSFPAWQQVCCLPCFQLFGSSCRISEDFVPSHGHWVSSWSTGGYERPGLILASHLSAEQSLILLFGRSRESRRAKSHLAGISQPGWIQLLAPETGCLLAVGVLMTPFQVSTYVFLIWSVQRACWEGISNSGTLPRFQVFLHW